MFSTNEVGSHIDVDVVIFNLYQVLCFLLFEFYWFMQDLKCFNFIRLHFLNKYFL